MSYSKLKLGGSIKKQLSFSVNAYGKMYANGTNSAKVYAMKIKHF